MHEAERDLSGTSFCDVDGTGLRLRISSPTWIKGRSFNPLKIFTHSLLRLRPGERILDVGCAAETNLRQLQLWLLRNGCAVGV